MECTANSMAVKNVCIQEKRDSPVTRWMKAYLKGLSAKEFEYMTYTK